MYKTLLTTILLAGSLVMCDPNGHKHKKKRHHCKKGRCCLPPPFFGPPPFFPPPPQIEEGAVFGQAGCPGGVCPLQPPVPLTRQQQLRPQQIQRPMMRPTPPVRRLARPFPTRTIRFTTTIRTTIATPFITTVFAPAATPVAGGVPAAAPCQCICTAVGETQVGSGKIVFECNQRQQQQAGGACPICPQQGSQMPGQQVKVEQCPELVQQQFQQQQVQQQQEVALKQGQLPYPWQEAVGPVKNPYSYPSQQPYYVRDGRGRMKKVYPQQQQGYSPGKGRMAPYASQGQAMGGYYGQPGQAMGYGAPQAQGYLQPQGQAVGYYGQPGYGGQYYAPAGGQGGYYAPGGYYGGATPCEVISTTESTSSLCLTTEEVEDSMEDETMTSSTADDSSDDESSITGTMKKRSGAIPNADTAGLWLASFLGALCFVALL